MTTTTTCLLQEPCTAHEVAATRTTLGRPRIPPPLDLDSSRGSTAIASDDLRALIGRAKGVNGQRPPRVVSPVHRIPESPSTSPTAMGNRPSSLRAHSSDTIDRDSIHSVVRGTRRRSRSSGDLFKKVVSWSRPLQHNDHAINGQNGHYAIPRNDRTTVPDTTADDAHPQDCSAGAVQDAVSDADRASMHRSDPSGASCSSVAASDTGDEKTSTLSSVAQTPVQPPDFRNALSPTLPTPPLMPEDSPHKYGLKDRASTPSLQKLAQFSHEDYAVVIKATRKSSGNEIFHDARSLQSATSFLNGLSAARRRAHIAELDEQLRPATISPPLPHSQDSSDHPLTNTHYGDEIRTTTLNVGADRNASDASPDVVLRRRALANKPSGFAFSRALNATQLNCFRAHAQLLPSSNRHASVECAVCHVDDDCMHFTCTWCALRVCRYCRDDLRVRGLMAIKDRIRMVQMGGGEANGDG